MPFSSLIHHITAITGNAQRNVWFYTKVLGLRLVKLTVNFDDPFTYHLYYGNAQGEPGTLLTFFVWEFLNRGLVGAGAVTAIAFSVPLGALSFWEKRLQKEEQSGLKTCVRFGEKILVFKDPDGLILELVETDHDIRMPWKTDEIPEGFAIRGFQGATLSLNQGEETEKLISHVFQLHKQEEEENRIRYGGKAELSGTGLDLCIDPALLPAHQGRGSVHHLAFRTENRATQSSFQDKLIDWGLQVTPPINRNYFYSIYFREPGQILFEIATDPPGFTIDEPLEKLGLSLKLPPQYEGMRSEIENHLPKLAL